MRNQCRRVGDGYRCDMESGHRLPHAFGFGERFMRALYAYNRDMGIAEEALLREAMDRNPLVKLAREGK